MQTLAEIKARVCMQENLADSNLTVSAGREQPNKNSITNQRAQQGLWTQHQQNNQRGNYYWG